MSKSRDMLRAVQRETATEHAVRFLDAADVVEWIHGLEDQIEATEVIKDALVKALERIYTRAKAHPDDTDEDRRRYLGHVAQIADAALKLAKEPTP